MSFKCLSTALGIISSVTFLVLTKAVAQVHLGTILMSTGGFLLLEKDINLHNTPTTLYWKTVYWGKRVGLCRSPVEKGLMCTCQTLVARYPGSQPRIVSNNQELLKEQEEKGTMGR